MTADLEMQLDRLADRLGSMAERHGMLSRHAAVGIGGPADLLIVARCRDDLVTALTQAWASELPVKVFGGVTNCLIADAGIAGVVILNKARDFRFEEGCCIYAESGAMMAKVAREASQQGWSGLTWAVSLPGTIGGAVVNNAGAFGGELSEVLLAAEIADPVDGVREVDPAWFDFRYRGSRLKGTDGCSVVVSVRLQLQAGDAESLNATAEEYTHRRQQTQPSGRTLGSTFKNPKGDYAGRLIEAAGLKGSRVGGVVVSEQHANFFINEGEGTAADYRTLVRRVQDEVLRNFGVMLEPEIEFVGRWA